VPTTGISLVREHTAAMRPPRFLWVPFELGRPFGAPHAPEFQRRVLRAALALLERPHGPVLEDFPDDAPEAAGDETAPWACPVSFRPPPGAAPAPADAVRDELARLAPWYELVLSRQPARAPADPHRLEHLVTRLAALARGEADAAPPGEGPLHEWLRLGCEELRAFYLDAARAQPGRASPRELHRWFWRDTAAARLIGAVALALRTHPEPLVRLLAARALVPREHEAALLQPAEAS
jgi:hypothetical protein